ncbi:Prostaglandin F synthase [Smittium culicis]|uniref:Prostaglandin F synthase n=1 Tax=Smittium culicis TaxID=133412 RepID=A0A1R1Y5Z8_9FUNG|nr:Prostaglandin F synthase [Smittium culicis]OMJ22214.1 Prostaglandin F synthase [Smittium culicis]
MYNNQRTVKLNNSKEIPILGLGTYRLKNKDSLKSLIRDAILTGYRHFDTATVYKNEEIIGEAFEEIFSDETLNISREDVWVTSKLSPSEQGYRKALNAVQRSLKNLKFDYIDMYLIHWPGVYKLKVSDPENSVKRQESWKALEELYSKGIVRSIGVSNYQIKHLKELATYSTVTPAVNQCEFHPLLYTKDLVDYCKESGISFMAYSSFGEGRLVDGSIKIPELDLISKKHNASTAQVLLSWSLHRGIIVIPKASSIKRLEDNFASLKIKLDDDDIIAIDSISNTNSSRFCWDSNTIS